MTALTFALSGNRRTASRSAPPQSAADPPASSPAASSAPVSSAPVSSPPVSSAPVSSAALTAAAASRQQAVAWVAAQVSHGVIVACDPLTCNALQQRGFPAADLSVITASSGDPLGSGVVISTTAVRSQLGPRLATVYAPDVMASFGSGASLVQVRVAAAGGAPAYLSAMQADLVARKVAGVQLISNKDIKMPSSAKAELAAGPGRFPASDYARRPGAPVPREDRQHQRLRAGSGPEHAAAAADGHRAHSRLPEPVACIPARAAVAVARGRLTARSWQDDHCSDRVHRPEPYWAAQRRSVSVTPRQPEHRPNP